MRVRIFASAFAAVALVAAPVWAQSAANVLVVINADSPDSVRVGEYYVEKRAVPATNVVRVNAALTDGVERAEYIRTIEAPIARWIGRHQLQDDIWYIVVTKGVPLRINGTGDRDGTLASVDSELTLLYRRLVGETVPLVGRVENPYFLGNRPLEEAVRFTRKASDLYLVTRLDGFTVEDAMGLVDRGIAPATSGTIVLDERAAFDDRGGDAWLEEAARRLTEDRDDATVLHEKTRTVASTSDPVLGYYSWGSIDPSNDLRGPALTFVPGAIGAMFMSNDGRTFVAPPDDWRPGDPSTGRGRMFAGSFQSLAGDLVRGGITGVAAHVAEPFLEATIRPQVLFPAYLSGFNLAEAFYLAMPYVSWRTIVIGDPLCAPFSRVALDPGELTSGLDPETELPRVFSARRLATITPPGYNADGLKLVLLGESREARDPDADVEALLVEATRLEPRVTSAQIRLAALAERRVDYTTAADRYRQVLASDPQDIVALNNLAYILAERLGAPAEALPLAQRAYRLDRRPLVADTLGWIHHLLGDSQAALPFIETAVAGAADNLDVRTHAAVVYAALGHGSQALRELEAAEKIDATIRDREDMVALRKRLEGMGRRGRPPGSN